MSTTIDDRVRAALGALAERAPLPPDFETIRQGRPAPVRGPRRIAVLSAVVVGAALLALLVVRAGQDETSIAGSGTTRVAPSDVPADFRLVNASDWREGPLSGTSFTYTTGAETFDEGDRALEVHVTDVDAAVLADSSGDRRSTERIDVRGHPAYLVTEEPKKISVLWSEGGVTIEINANQLSREEVLRAADSVEPLSEDEWEAVRRRD